MKAIDEGYSSDGRRCSAIFVSIHLDFHGRDCANAFSLPICYLIGSFRISTEVSCFPHIIFSYLVYFDCKNINMIPLFMLVHLKFELLSEHSFW